MKRVIFFAVALFVAMSCSAFAEIVTVECKGTVEYNQINQGIFAEVSSGDVVYAGFLIDSDIFMDSPTYNVRGYPIDLVSFQLDIGPVGAVPLVIPQPNDATPYFVVRNDDPAADGFFLSSNIDWPSGNPMLDVPGGIDPYFGFHWEVGYGGDVLSSLDILDAVGTYTFDGLTSFYTAIQDSWADAMGLVFVQMDITVGSVATENVSWGSVKSLYR